MTPARPGLAPPALITGARVQLRRSTPDDARGVYRAAADDEVMRFLEWRPHLLESDARAYLDGCAARWAAGTEHHWVIEPRGGGELQGCIAARPKGHAVDLGYFLARPAWGRGIATEAGQLLMGWLQRQPGVLRIWATTDVDNHRSAAVLMRLGMQREGLLRMATVRPQVGALPRDTLVFGWCRRPPA